jgi:TolA-binding protein
MALPYFLSFILVLALGWMQFFWTAQKHFNGVGEYKEKIEALNVQVNEQRLKTKLAQEDYLEFRQNVASLMPHVLPIAGQGEKGYPLRNLAAVLAPGSNEAVTQLISKTLFERGQQLFREKKFQESNHVFKQFIDRYSYSQHTPEAYFLWLDGSFQLGDFSQCAELANQMVELFPGTELTGFALLRLGRVFENQGRAEDAVDIYKTVMRSYPQRDLSSEAKKSLQGLDL